MQPQGFGGYGSQSGDELLRYPSFSLRPLGLGRGPEKFTHLFMYSDSQRSRTEISM